MQSSISNESLVERNAAMLRGAVAILAAFGLVLGRGPVDRYLVFAGSVYLLIAIAAWWLASKVYAWWLPYPLAVVDAAAVTALLLFWPEAGTPLWVLYIFPIAIGAIASPGAATLAVVLSMIGYAYSSWPLGPQWLRSGLPPASGFDGWVLAALGGFTLMCGMLASRWVSERAEKRAWRELSAAMRVVIGDGNGDPEEVGVTVVREVQRLVKAQAVWLLWLEPSGDLAQGPVVGTPLGELSPEPQYRDGLRHGAIALNDLYSLPSGVEGEVLQLGEGPLPAALLVVCWDRGPRDQALKTQRLHVFAPCASGALVAALGRVAARKRLEQEQISKHAAAAMAATLDPVVVQNLLIDAVRQALGGDVLPVRWEGPAEFSESGSLLVRVDETRGILVRHSQPDLDSEDFDWVRALAGIATAALEKCALHEALVQAEARLRETWESLPGAAALWQRNGDPFLANRAFRELTAEHQLSWNDLGGEEITLGKDGLTLAIRRADVREGDYHLALLSDITKERDALRAKEDLISLIGHELRTPLTSIYGYSQMMGRNLSVVQRQINQLNRLISDILDESQLEGGKLSLSWQMVDVAVVARSASERFSGAHPEATLRLDLEDVPQVRADSSRMGQILDNLLDNAVKYSAEDTEITLIARKVGDELHIAVRDDGMGIPPDQLEHLFDRYYRAPGNETKRINGLGLGLSIVRELVAAHDGRVWAESDGPGKGSTFCFSLPLAEQPANVPSEVA